MITAEALRSRGDELAAGLAGSFQLGAGQYCTKPGIVFAPRGGGFAERVARHLAPASLALLSDPISNGFRDGLDTLISLPGMTVHRDATGGDGIRPLVLATSIDRVLENPSAHLVECFGPVTVVVEYASSDDVTTAIRAIGGSLTATLHGAPGEGLAALADELSAIAGRVLFDGWPTGVAVGWAQQHGGPWPSSTAPHTSVGATAIRRFLRPVAWQSAPDHLLPPELREANPLGIPRRVDGALVLADREGGA
ncbi:hypothetical protein GCM10025869_19240 [Homoserinibacter gongjuensis]|uniref:Uncharacterized protein n=1 Tax=Homoserinibacter gongjuensis TaxID=1162968 RepID=A0ABQ6JSW2_9MICO|nr:hypothetical protein GCM10025869_19240 [Homoserinibacter gongjuensis]